MNKFIKRNKRKHIYMKKKCWTYDDGSRYIPDPSRKAIHVGSLIEVLHSLSFMGYEHKMLRYHLSSFDGKVSVMNIKRAYHYMKLNGGNKNERSN